MLLNYQNTLISLVISVGFFFSAENLLIILVTDLVSLQMCSLSELFLSLNCGKNTSHANCPLKFVSEQYNIVNYRHTVLQQISSDTFIFQNAFITHWKSSEIFILWSEIYMC